MKVYISGKVSGLPLNQVHAKFSSAEKHLTCLGYDVVNPLNNGLTNEHSWAEHMTEDIKLLFGCNAIYLLSDWVDSRGAMIEKYIAELSGFKIISQSKEDVDKANEARQEMIFYKVESAIYDITGLKREQYAVKSKLQTVYFLRMIYVHYCFSNGVQNKSLLARRIGKDHATVYRILKIYADEIKYNTKFRELANKVDKRLSRISDFGSQQRELDSIKLN